MSRKNIPVHIDEDTENSNPNVHSKTHGGEPTNILKKLLSPANETVVSNNAVSYLQKVTSFFSQMKILLIRIV
jgi:hypothetical protein